MKLVILGSRGIPACYGGYETFAEQLAVRLVASGVQVTVACPSDHPKADAVYRGVRLSYLTVQKLGAFEQLLWDVSCLWHFRHGFNVVYMLGVGASFAAWIPRIHGSAVWINTDGIEWKRSKWSLPQRAYLWFAESLATISASRIIADSSAIERFLRRRHPHIRRISTVPYGADVRAEKPDPRLIEKWALQPGAYYIVVCRLEPENHLMEIVRGFQQSKVKVPLIILGNIEMPNPYVTSLLNAACDRIRFIGTVYDAEQLAALRFYARAYIHGHSVGGTNPSLLEAMACANLVIAHNNPFNREVLDTCGFYFKDSPELAWILDSVDSAGDQTRRLRECAVERVKLCYQWDQIAKTYLEILHCEISQTTFDSSEP